MTVFDPYEMVMVLEPAKPVPATVTLDPTAALEGDSEIEGWTWKGEKSMTAVPPVWYTRT